MAVPLPLLLVFHVYLRNVLSATQSMSLASNSGTSYVEDEAEDDTGSDFDNVFIAKNNGFLVFVVVGFVNVELNVDLEE